jgi:hypothetical protein
MTTLIVGPGQQYTDIQEAINAAKQGDTVLINPVHILSIQELTLKAI